MIATGPTHGGGPSRGSIVLTAGALCGLWVYLPWALPYVGAVAGSGVAVIAGCLAYEALARRRVRNRPRWQAITERENITDEEIAELIRILRSSRKPLTNNDLADKLGVVKGEASKRVSKAVQAGLVTRLRQGKSVSISLLH